MFPWKIEDIGRIVVGRPLLPIFQEMFLAKKGHKPSRQLLEKLHTGTTDFRAATIQRYDLGIVNEVRASEPMQRDEYTRTPYRNFLELGEELYEIFAGHPEVNEAMFGGRLLYQCFPQTIGAIIWAEDWWASLQERGGRIKINEPDGPTSSFPVSVLDNMPESRDEAERCAGIGMLLEHHLFMLYFAAFEEDIAKQTAVFAVPRPSLFFPTEEQNGSPRYPMWRFWRWFAGKAGCETWVELAKKADFNKRDSPDGAEGEQLVRNWANAKPLPGEWSAGNCKMISWKRLRQALAKVEGVSDPLSPFQLEIQWGYGIARILQEHAARCLPVIQEFITQEFTLKSFYQYRIAACKKNECRRIPPAPMYGAL
mgnify:CR=1 FL=1